MRELCREQKVLPEEELDRALDPVGMTRAGCRRFRERVKERFCCSLVLPAFLFDMVANVNGPHFSGGANIAIKCPSHSL